MVRVIGMQTGELEVGLREAGTRRVVIINVVEAVRIGSSEGVEKVGEEREAWILQIPRCSKSMALFVF